MILFNVHCMKLEFIPCDSMAYKGNYGQFANWMGFRLDLTEEAALLVSEENRFFSFSVEKRSIR